MWVRRAESPLALGPLYVRSPFERKEKVEIPGAAGGKLSGTILGLGEEKPAAQKNSKSMGNLPANRVASLQRRS
jgi:hypothetical protein